jgi:hypothetical protein
MTVIKSMPQTRREKIGRHSRLVPRLSTTSEVQLEQIGLLAISPGTMAKSRGLSFLTAVGGSSDIRFEQTYAFGRTPDERG